MKHFIQQLKEFLHRTIFPTKTPALSFVPVHALHPLLLLPLLWERAGVRLGLGRLLLLWGIVGGLISCNDTEAYYKELTELPQLDMRDLYAYAGSFNVGDSLTMYGKFQQPQNPLSISIGGVEAEIVKKEKVLFDYSRNDSNDVVTVVITEAMGYGKGRPVTLTSGNKTINCPSIEIIDGASLEPYAFTGTLTLTEYASLPSGTITWVETKNGTGNLYYYRSTDKSFYHIQNSETEVVLSLDKLKESLGSSFDIRNLQAATVDAAEENLYFAARTNTSYELIRYNFASAQATILNTKPTTAQNVTGSYANGDVLGTLELAFSRLQTDNKGGLYVWISGSGVTNAGVAYISSERVVDYLFTLNGNTLLPASLAGNAAANTALLSPQDGVFYTSSTVNPNNTTISQYNLLSPRLIQQFTSASATNNPDNNFTGFFGNIYLPQAISYDYIRLKENTFLYFRTNTTLKALELFVTDFTNERVVPYAPGFDAGNYAGNFASTARLLNYDSDKHLYFVQGTTILKTTVKQ